LDPKTKQAAEVLLNTLERLSGKKAKKPVVPKTVRRDDVEMVRPNIRSSGANLRASIRRKDDDDIGPSMMTRNPLFIQAQSQPMSSGIPASIQQVDNPASPSQAD